jgi:3-hydroxyisobutyrate dehydrogenase-like beta-hydroxyacid dehydrogenase
VNAVAFLGTGMIGSAMVERMLEAGTPVVVWNRTASKAHALQPHGAGVASTPHDAVRRASRVHISVSDDAAVDELLDDILPAVAADAIVIDHSTTSPSGTKARFSRCAASGVRFVHAPVFMSPQMAREGGGLMIVSAAAREFDALRPLLEAMTGEVWYVGERPELAAAHKLFGNAMLFAISGGLTDIFAMAKATSVPFSDALTVFTKWSVLGALQMRGTKMATGDLSPRFGLTMARKDIRLMLETARGQPLTVLPAIAKRMDETIGAGLGDKDLAAIVTPVLKGE